MALIELLKRLCYNTTERNSEDDSMDIRFGYFFTQTAFPKSHLNNMLSITEFVEKGNAIQKKNHKITDEDIYGIVKELYLPKYLSGERSGEALKLSRAIRAFAKVLYQNEYEWKDEFDNAR